MRRSPQVGRGSKLLDRHPGHLRLRSPPSRGRGSKPSCAGRPDRRAGSPPSRGRGSKRHQGDAHRASRRSPPSRGRGSKQTHGPQWHAANRSPPSRGRGSKLYRDRQAGRWCDVAPFPGAWIETGMRSAAIWRRRVAPFPGAWIETQSGRRPKQCARVTPENGIRSIFKLSVKFHFARLGHYNMG